jgi:hypothetical protein
VKAVVHFSCLGGDRLGHMGIEQPDSAFTAAAAALIIASGARNGRGNRNPLNWKLMEVR